MRGQHWPRPAIDLTTLFRAVPIEPAPPPPWWPNDKQIVHSFQPPALLLDAGSK